MAMYRKDYNALAEAIKEVVDIAKTPEERRWVCLTTLKVVKVVSKLNGNFKFGRFMNACGFEQDPVDGTYK